MTPPPGRPEVVLRTTEEVMGTVVSFDLRPRGLAHDAQQAGLAHAREILHRADDVFSLYRPDTPMSRHLRGELALADCPAEVGAVLQLCARVRDLSDGWFDPWALPGGLDPTGLVKGWAAREAARALRAAGVGAGLVNAAGDIQAFGTPADGRSWRIGVRSPSAADELAAIVRCDAAVATSGSYERGDHVRDVRRGGPARAAVSATVTGEDLAIADGLATGLLAAGRDGLALAARAGYEAMVIDPGGAMHATAQFPLATD